MCRGSQSHCRPKLCLSLAGQLVLPGWLQLFAGRQALPAKILAYLGTNTCLRRPNRYPGHWPMGFPDSRGPKNPNCSAHCAGPGNGSSRHSVMDLCAPVDSSGSTILDFSQFLTPMDSSPAHSGGLQRIHHFGLLSIFNSSGLQSGTLRWTPADPPFWTLVNF